jgi:chlorite dismutase
MDDTRQAPLTLEGWYVLHQFFRISWPHVSGLDPGERKRRARELAAFFQRWSPAEESGRRDGNDGDGSDGAGWSGLYRIVGGAVDLMAVHFRPDIEGLGAAERSIQGLELSEHLALTHDYLSVVELGLYGLTQELLAEARDEGFAPGSEEWDRRTARALEAEREKAFVQRRLRPRQPDRLPYVCFYPMDKRRRPGQNWYALSLEERGSLMREHGHIGRGYVDRISQVISGSIGLDDWEWAVTLFGSDPLDFKELVTVMRYDEASAEYAEFGPFYVGKRMHEDQIAEDLQEV